MMTLLVPLGLLGLLGIVALIIIYIIKPNYQVKHVSSTYVWKLSLKYRKKRLPTNRIRNLIIFLCQIMILTLIAGILTMPVLREEGKGDRYDVIAVIDSSASMYTGESGSTRFLRAVDEASALSEEVFARGGYFSLILADDDPAYALRRVSVADRSEAVEVFQELIDDENACYYGKADIDGAMKLCEEVIVDNPAAATYLYTDIEYEQKPDGVEVINVSEEDEWNAAILSAKAEIEDNFYTVTVQIACYGISRELSLKVDVQGANSFDEEDSGVNISFSKAVECEANVPQTIIFREAVGEDGDNTFYYPLSASERFYSYKTMRFSIDEADSFTIDNNFYLYGGQKQVLKVQYASALPNPFFTGALDVLQNEFSARYDLQVTDVRQGDDYATSGFDFYIFEHQTPQVIPTDGVVFLVDPEVGYSNSSIGLYVTRENTFREEMALTAGVAHQITKNIYADNITVTRYKELNFSSEFETLLFCDMSPVLMAQKNGAVQIAVLGFSLHYSSLAEKPEFYILLHNIFDYYFPAVTEGTSFEVGESIVLNSRGPEVTVSNLPEPVVEFPTTLEFQIPGTYTLGVGSYFDTSVTTVELYIKIPEEESNIKGTEYSFNAPYREKTDTFDYDDLLIYLAAALVLLLFTEWWLQWRETK